MTTNLRPYASRFFNSLLEVVLPVHCLGCGSGSTFLCAQCVGSFPRLEPPFCNVCADPGVNGTCRSCQNLVNAGLLGIQGVRAPYLMEGLVREAVHGFKYRNCRVAAPALASALAQYLQDNPLPGELLAPVPLHRKKLRERGYNQAGLLARELAKITGMPMDGNLLARTRHAPAQAFSASRQQRQENIREAFQCRRDVSGEGIILVDDVCTTGSTLNACARALQEAGAGSVWGLALARESLRGA